MVAGVLHGSLDRAATDSSTPEAVTRLRGRTGRPPAPWTWRSTSAGSIARRHTMHGRPVPRLDLDTPLTGGRRASDRRARICCRNSPSEAAEPPEMDQPGVRGRARRSLARIMDGPPHNAGTTLWCRGISLRKGEPDSTGRGARMRQPENPQEAIGVYTGRRGRAWW